MHTLRRLFGGAKLYFLALVPLLLATAFIQVRCPVCGGAGTVSESIHMEDVHIISVDSMIFGYTKDACSMYILVRSRPSIMAANLGTEVAKGWLKMELYDTKREKLLATQYLAVELNPSTVSSLSYPLAFGYISPEDPEGMDITATVLNDSVACLACNGQGTLALNTQPLVQAFRSRLIQQTQAEQEFRPDPREGTEEWHYMMED